MDHTIIELDLKKIHFNNSVILDQFQLSVKKGETVAITGRSGSGKSTILRIVAGLHPQFSGLRKIDANVRTALIPQQHCLLPWKTVIENLVALTATEKRRPDRNAALKLAGRLGLAGVERKYPLQLSGGQYQRLVLGQALFYRPDLLLMDEPFSSLDALTRLEMQELFCAMRSTHDLTAILVTHHKEEAETLADRIVPIGGFAT